MAEFKGKNVLITGAAHGIGKLMAEMVGERGGNLLISDINAAGLETTAAEFRKKGYNVKTYICDISQREAVYALAGKIHAEAGQVDILINNAGMVTVSEILALPDEKHRQQVEVNLLGTLWMIKAFVPDMVKRNAGYLVNVASSAGLQAMPGMGIYSATKHALVGLNEALRLEFGNNKIKVRTMVVCPYLIKTGMFEGMKTPFFMPGLEPETMAKGVIQGIEKNRSIVILPLLLHAVLLFKGFVPPLLWDFGLRIAGFTRALYGIQGFCKMK